MDLHLIKATAVDAETMLELQKKCFAMHFERYHDVEKSPYNDTTDKILSRITRGKSNYYKMILGKLLVGCLWVVEKEPEIFRIGIVYVIPQYQNKGIGQQAFAMAESLHSNAICWELDCPEDLARNRHCYEKLGYKLTGEQEIVNDKLTLVYYRKQKHNELGC